MQSVEKIFLTITLLFGLLFVFINPPFQSPDEPEHFFKMYGYTKGVLRHEVLNHKAGLIMPESFLKLKNMYSSLPFNYFATTSLPVLKCAMKISLEPEKTVFIPHNPTSYLPVSYFPIFIFLKIFLLLKLPPLIILYLLRITELFLYTGLMWLAIRTTPVKKWLFAFLGMLPTSVYIASSVNTDPWVISLSVLLCAYFLKLAYDNNVEKITLKNIGIISLLLFVITLCKLAYLPIALLFLIIPKEKFSSLMQQMLYCIIVFSVGISAFLLFMWYGTANFSGAIASSAIKMSDNSPNLLAHILSHPIFYLQRMHFSAKILYPDYLSTFIGRFGWLDTFLPPMMIKLYWSILFVVALIDTKDLKEFKIKLFDKVIFFMIFYMAFVVMFLSGFLTFKKLYPYIVGVQGRYFLPIAPIIFLPFANRIFVVSQDYLKKIVMYSSFTGLSISLYFIILRFYMTSGIQLWY